MVKPNPNVGGSVMFKPIPGITSYSSFYFVSSGKMKVQMAYGIGGKEIATTKYEEIPAMNPSLLAPYTNSVAGARNIYEPRKASASTDRFLAM